MADVPEEVLEDLQIHCVDMVDEVLKLAIASDDNIGEIEKEPSPIYTDDNMSNEVNLT